MTPLVLLWGSTASFLAGLWLGAWALVAGAARRRARHASRAGGALMNGARGIPRAPQIEGRR